MGESVDVKKPIQLRARKAGVERWYDVHIVYTSPRGVCVIVSEQDDIFQVINIKNITREFGYRNRPDKRDNVLDFNDYKER